MPQDPLEYLFSLERLGMKFGLEGITRLCGALGDPQHAFRSVLVAGTNGKGSVTAMTERGLRAAGHRTGRYTSPHLSRVEERFAIAGGEVSTDDLRRAVGRVRHAADGLLDDKRLEAPPTFFECTTAAAFVLFRDADVEIAVLEVGLGGRLDATNVVHPLVAAITSIDFDHQAQLGETIEAIASEKAGIVKPGIPVVCGPVPAAAERVIREACEARGATLVSATDRVDPAKLLDGLQPSLRGAHQRANASVAVALLNELDGLGVRVPQASVRLALTDVDWPGRLEEFSFNGARVLLDAAHNPAGARALKAFLQETAWSGVLLFGAMQDKDARAMLAELAPLADTVICTTAPTARAAPADALAGIARSVAPSVPIESIADAREALTRASTLGRRVAVAGSIFLIGPLRDILRAP